MSDLVMHDLPNDADGDALRRLQADGSDLSRPMEIDFAVLVPDAATGRQFAALVEPSGFRTHLQFNDESGRWTCYCIRTLIPTYDEIIKIQSELDELGHPLGAKSDGWGSFGNAPE